MVPFLKLTPEIAERMSIETFLRKELPPKLLKKYAREARRIQEGADALTAVASSSERDPVYDEFVAQVVKSNPEYAEYAKRVKKRDDSEFSRKFFFYK